MKAPSFAARTPRIPTKKRMQRIKPRVQSGAMPRIGTSSPHAPGGPSDAMLDGSEHPPMAEHLGGLMGQDAPDSDYYG